MTMSSTNARGSRPTVLLVTVLLTAGCSDSTAPTMEGPGSVELYQPPPALSQYSMQSSGLSGALTWTVDQATGGRRWCAITDSWFEPASESCGGRAQQPPYGHVTQEGGDLILVGDQGRAAPFIWTGPPTRANPFPSTGDFTLDVRMKADQLGYHGVGLYILGWDPALTEGSSDPNANLLMVVWNNWNGVRVRMRDVIRPIKVENPLAEHAYHLAYEDGAYTLYIDGLSVAGPFHSDFRPTAAWIGNPNFERFSAAWTDIRLSQFNVSTPAEEVVAVSVDIKPGGCPSPLNLKSRGVLPVAIAGTEDLDVSQIDASTLRLEGVAVTRSNKEDVATAVEPYVGKTVADCSADGPDGSLDLTAKFPTEALAAVLSDTEDGEERTLTLTGNLLPEFGGTPITGEDVVIIKR